MTTPEEPITPQPPAGGASATGRIPDLSEFMTPPRRRRDWRGSRSALTAGAIVLAIVLLGVGVVIGRFTAPSGPPSLAAAVQQARAGTLPCGTGVAARLCAAGGFGAPGGAGGTGGARGGTGGGLGFGRGGGAGGFGVVGTVSSVGNGTLTIQTRGGSVQLTLPSSATVSKTVAGSTSDLAAGDTVQVTTTTDSSGQRTVQRITILPPPVSSPAGPGTANG